MMQWSGVPTAQPAGLWGMATAWFLPAPPVKTSSIRGRGSDEERPDAILIGKPCPRDGCLLYWPAWQGQPPRCKVCALDENLEAMRRHGTLTHALRAGKEHIPSDLVVDQWVSNVESSSPRDFLLRHDLWTTFRHLLWSQITSVISMAWNFTTKSGGIWIIFETARDVYDQMQKDWRGSKEYLLSQLVRLVEQFIRSDSISIIPALFSQEDLKRRLIITLNMTKVVQHIWEAIRFDNTEKLEPQVDRDRPIRSTDDMGTWYTGKPCQYTRRSHINFCVYDSTWEAAEAFTLDQHSAVDAWVKNDHLGFEVLYVYRGVVRKYRPDFLIRLQDGSFLVLETKGRDTEQDRTKRRFLDEWVQAVNTHGGFGQWAWDVSRDPDDLPDILARHVEAGRPSP